MAKEQLLDPIHPKVYPDLLKIRSLEDPKMKPCKYLPPEISFRNYQIKGILHMLLMTRFVLGDDCGLGKTLQCLAAYAYTLEKDPTIKCIVVCPKSAATQWAAEISKFTPDIKVKILQNSSQGKSYRAKQYFDFWTGDTNILVVSYHWVRDDVKLYEPFLQGHSFTLIVDEAAAIKNPTSKLHKAIDFISRSPGCKRCYGITATPMKNNPLDGYGVFKAICPQVFSSLGYFKRVYCVEKMMSVPTKNGSKNIPQIVGYKNMDHYKKAIDPYFLGRKKHDVSTELPEMITKKIECDMSETQERAYAEALSGLLELDNGDSKETTVLTQLIYCQQIVNSPNLVGIDGPSGKEQELLRLLEEELQGEHIIIYSRFKQMVDRLENIFSEHNIVTVRITGDETDAQRELSKYLFQQDQPAIQKWIIDRSEIRSDRVEETRRKRELKECHDLLNLLRSKNFPRVIFLTPAGSESLNLQKASTFIFYDTPWSPGEYQQLVGRMIRIGSERSTVMVLHMICPGTIDDHVLRKQAGKMKPIEQVLGSPIKGAFQFVSDVDVKDLVQALKLDAMSRASKKRAV